MKTLVLGGTGFVGRRLVEVLTAEGAGVTVLNRGITPVELPPGVARLVADRSDATSMRAVLARTEWDAVFDVSGVAKVAGGTDPGDLADLLADRVGRYVYVSSQSLYRMTGAFPWREDSPIVEPDVAAYGGFKVATERALLARHVTSGFPATIARPAAIYGPYNNIYDMEAAMFRRLLERRPVLLPYHGLVVGSYGHVDDLCRALRVMAAHPSAVGEVFNVTTSAVTSAAYVATLAEVVGVEPDVVLVPDDLAQTAERPLFSRLFTPAHHGMLDPSKITRVLGLSPVYDLRAGHVQTLEWFCRSGAAVMNQALSDPLWGRTFDFAYEAEVAALARDRGPANLGIKETRWTPTCGD
jgi:nucleoside-diphosphate-sugar epimerase